MEIWKDVKGYEGFYQISNLGNVRRLKVWDVNKKGYRERVRKLSPTSNGKGGYLIVGLMKGGRRKNHYVHRMVAEAFIENPNNYPQVNHIDYDRKNNNAKNLEWCTSRQNTIHSIEHMRKPRPAAPLGVAKERYICYRKSTGEYRVIIHLKEYGTRKSLEDAVKLRNDILKETKYADVNNLRK